MLKYRTRPNSALRMVSLLPVFGTNCSSYLKGSRSSG